MPPSSDQVSRIPHRSPEWQLKEADLLCAPLQNGMARLRDLRPGEMLPTLFCGRSVRCWQRSTLHQCSSAPAVCQGSISAAGCSTAPGVQL